VGLLWVGGWGVSVCRAVRDPLGVLLLGLCYVIIGYCSRQWQEQLIGWFVVGGWLVVGGWGGEVCLYLIDEKNDSTRD
jgi:hypothetical protein